MCITEPHFPITLYLYPRNLKCTQFTGFKWIFKVGTVTFIEQQRYDDLEHAWGSRVERKYSYSFLTLLSTSKSYALGPGLFIPVQETRLPLYEVEGGPKCWHRPKDTYFSVFFGHPASKPFIILTKVRIQFVAVYNVLVIRLGISTNMISNTLLPVLGMYFSR
jgi:hypothetical protein